VSPKRLMWNSWSPVVLLLKLDHKDTNLINRLIHGWVHSWMCYEEVASGQRK
jgi:hypothetical protein